MISSHGREPHASLIDCDFLLKELSERDNVSVDSTMKELNFDDINQVQAEIDKMNEEAMDSNLLNRENTEAFIHKPIETLLDKQKPIVPLRRSSRVQNKLDYDDDKIRIECEGSGTNNRVTFDKNLLVEEYGGDGDEDLEVTTVKIPIFSSHLSTVDTSNIKIKIRELEEEKANMTAERLPDPPNFTNHIHYTKAI